VTMADSPPEEFREEYGYPDGDGAWFESLPGCAGCVPGGMGCLLLMLAGVVIGLGMVVGYLGW